MTITCQCYNIYTIYIYYINLTKPLKYPINYAMPSYTKWSNCTLTSTTNNCYYLVIVASSPNTLPCSFSLSRSISMPGYKQNRAILWFLAWPGFSCSFGIPTVFATLNWPGQPPPPFSIQVPTATLNGHIDATNPIMYPAKTDFFVTSGPPVGTLPFCC